LLSLTDESLDGLGHFRRFLCKQRKIKSASLALASQTKRDVPQCACKIV